MAESWKGDDEGILISYVENKLAFLLDIDLYLITVFNSYDTTVSLDRHSVACRPDCDVPDMVTCDRNSNGHYNDNYNVDSFGNDAAIRKDLNKVNSEGNDAQWWSGQHTCKSCTIRCA